MAKYGKFFFIFISCFEVMIWFEEGTVLWNRFCFTVSEIVSKILFSKENDTKVK